MPTFYSNRILGYFPYVNIYPDINKIEYYCVGTICFFSLLQSNFEMKYKFEQKILKLFFQFLIWLWQFCSCLYQSCNNTLRKYMQ